MDRIHQPLFVLKHVPVEALTHESFFCAPARLHAEVRGQKQLLVVRKPPSYIGVRPPYIVRNEGIIRWGNTP